MHKLERINNQLSKPKYLQVIQAVLEGIETGKYTEGQLLPSINKMASINKSARETINKAYAVLREQGVIMSQRGKGFYVANSKTKPGLNIFVLFDTFFSFKEVLFKSLTASLPKNTRFTIFFHHYDVHQFEQLIKSALGNYNFYIVMPHLNTDVSAIVSKIPRDKLLILDSDIPRLSSNGYAAVYQDFEKDVIENLQKALPWIKKYKNLHLVLGRDHLQFVPAPFIKGYKKFCKIKRIPGKIMDTLEEKNIHAGDAYLTIHDFDNVNFIKYCEKKKWKSGKDIGLISLDDSPFREILAGGITVISTDFEKMGISAGQLIKEKRIEKIANPSMFIKRKTL